MKIASPDGGKETRPRPVNSKLLSGAGDTMVAPWGGKNCCENNKDKIDVCIPTHTVSREGLSLCTHSLAPRLPLVHVYDL